MKIDVHNHIYPPEYIDALEVMARHNERLAAEVRSTLPWLRREPQMWSVERRVEYAEKISLNLQVLSLSRPNVYFDDFEASVSLCQLSNDTFLAHARAYPGHFRVFASLPMHVPGEALRELARIADEPEVVGVIIGSNCHRMPLNDPSFLPIYADLERRQLPIFLHPMTPPGFEEMLELGLDSTVGYLFDTTLAATRMVFAGVFEQYPRLNLILPHLGATIPYMLGRIEHAYRGRPDLQARIPHSPRTYFQRFYYDTVSGHVPSLRLVAETFGVSQMVFGTDFPFWDDVTAIYEDVRGMGLPEAEEEAIFSGNAARVLTRLGAAAAA